MAGDPERDARELLEAVWVQGSRIDLPVDPIYIAQQLGIKVFTAYFDEGVSGTLVKRPGYDPEINLNAHDSRNRQRFTCAHELGHYVKRTRERDDDDWSFIDRRDLLAARGTDPEEIYANKFAAALLMPADLVTKEWERHHNSATLAYRFGVSADAMNYRLDNLGLQ